MNMVDERASAAQRGVAEEKRSITVNGISSDQALDALAYVEQHVPGQISGRRTESRRYLRYREWLIHETLLRKTLTTGFVPHHEAIPGLDMPLSLVPRMRRIFRLAGSLLDPRASTLLAARADAVAVRSNLRGFYLSANRPLTIKVALRSPETSFCRPVTECAALTDIGMPLEEVSSSGAWLHREVIARKYAEQFVDGPQLLGYDFSGAYAYLVEPLVWGTNPSSRSAIEAVCEVLTPRLLKLYEHYGYRFRFPSEILGDDAVLLEVEAALIFLSTTRTEKRKLLAAAERLLNISRRVAVSFTHGDLTSSNILIDREGTISVLDWERSGENMAAIDFCFLLDKAPKRMKQVAAAMLKSQAKFLPVNEICSLPEQLGVLGVRELASWRRQLQHCEWGKDIQTARRRLLFHRDLVEQMLVGSAGLN